MNPPLPNIHTPACLSRVAIFALFSLSFASLYAAPPPGRGFNSTPTFNDEFTDPGVDESKWKFRTGARFLDGSPQCVNSPNNVVQNGDGFLRLIGEVRPVQWNDGYRYPTVGGGVISKQTFKYGYYETRAKLTSESGWHSSFWLMGDGAQGIRQENEIDGFEIDSARPAKVTFNTHFYRPSHVSWPREKFDVDLFYNLPPETNPPKHSGNTFYVYGWEWTPDEVIFYIGKDGEPMREARRISYPGPHAAQNFWLSLLGWQRFGEPRSNNDTYIAFDYFRYYAKSYGIGTGLGSNSGRIVSSPAYSSGWTVSDMAYDQNSGNTTRYSTQPGAEATWTPNLPATGSYEVFAWNPSYYIGSSTSTRYVIEHANGSSTSPDIDQSMDGQKWISLGAYRFTSGSGGRVRATVPSNPTGNLRTAGMMFRAFDLADCDFDYNTASLVTLSGAWNRVPLTGHVGNQGYRTYSNGETLVRWMPSTWENYFVRGSFKLNHDNSNAGVVARFENEDNYYLFRIDRPSRTLAILRKADGNFTTLVEMPFTASDQTWYDLMLVVENDANAVRLRGLLNGHEELAARDASALRIPSGTVGFRTYHNETSGDVILDRFGAGR